MISALATCYLFLGGTGAGALVLLSVIEGVRTLRRCPSTLLNMPRELLAKSWVACVLALALGIVCLSVDLGRFDRVLTLVASTNVSPLTIGAFALAGALIVAAVGAVCENFEGAALSVGSSRVVCVLGLVLGLVTITYTGVLLQGMAAVVAWQTPLVTVLFVLSSLSCGCGVVAGCAGFVESRQPIVRSVHGVLCFDSVIILCEGATLVAFAIWLAGDVRTQEAAASLVTGDLALVFWGVLVVVGLLVPFVVERFTADMSHHFMLVWTAAALLAGGAALRFCVVALAIYDPSQAYATEAYVASQVGLAPIGVGLL